ncbi:4-hydroxy-2-oxo-heptane-1,7-dioate aldolase, partial [Klebsiella pneumoniae]|nr:4-hydroxy-2-oxo-heptane-1,7-dioate aldolase [Klebsiella pneumoniae]
VGVDAVLLARAAEKLAGEFKDLKPVGKAGGPY